MDYFKRSPLLLIMMNAQKCFESGMLAPGAQKQLVRGVYCVHNSPAVCWTLVNEHTKSNSRAEAGAQ